MKNKRNAEKTINAFLNKSIKEALQYKGGDPLIKEAFKFIKSRKNALLFATKIEKELLTTKGKRPLPKTVIKIIKSMIKSRKETALLRILMAEQKQKTSTRK
jgi:hypothetical protein